MNGNKEFERFQILLFCWYNNEIIMSFEIFRQLKGGLIMAIATEGETIQVHSYKHNGNIHRVWQETMVLKGTRNIVIGANERTLVTEADGRHG